MFKFYVLAIIVDSPWDCKEDKEVVLLDNQSIGVCACSVMSDSLWPVDLTPWTVECQAPLSMEFSRQECWTGLLCPPPGDLSDWCLLQLQHCRQIIYHWVTRKAHGTENRQLAKNTGNNVDVWLAPEHFLFNHASCQGSLSHRSQSQGAYVFSALLLN